MKAIVRKKRVELAGLRADAAFATEQFAMSERRACRLVELDRSSYRYEPRADHNAQLREELVSLARQKPRYGYRRLHVLLSQRGHPASAQRIHRLYYEERLMVRRLTRTRLVRPANEGRLLLRSDQEWALDFACDALATGRGIRIRRICRNAEIINYTWIRKWRQVAAAFCLLEMGSKLIGKLLDPSHGLP